jgi:hypothetical protein
LPHCTKEQCAACVIPTQEESRRSTTVGDDLTRSLVQVPRDDTLGTRCSNSATDNCSGATRYFGPRPVALGMALDHDETMPWSCRCLRGIDSAFCQVSRIPDESC